MKKTLLATAIAVTALASVNAQADIAITTMSFGADYAASGTFLTNGGGTASSIDPFYGNHWTSTQQTAVMDNTGNWSGDLTGSTTTGSAGGTFNFNQTIHAMTANQVAVGMFFEWNNTTEIAVLEIFDCAAGVCTGNGVPMANGPFSGSIAIFSGTGTNDSVTIPVPAAVWLMGSGLLGLVGVARRRKA